MLPLSEKVKVLNKERKKKSYAAVANIYENSSLCEIVKKEKGIRTSFAVAPQTVKVLGHSMW